MQERNKFKMTASYGLKDSFTDIGKSKVKRYQSAFHF